MSFGLELVNFYRGFRRPSSFAAAGPGCNRESDTPPFESAFVCGGAQVVQRKTAGDRKSRPYGGFESGPFFFVGAGHWPARRGEFCHSETHHHPPRMRSAPSPLQGEGLRAIKGRPYEIRKTLRPFRRGRRPRRPAGAHCAPLQRETRWERWFGKARRGSETAPAAILEQPGPSGPVGI